MYFVCVYEVGYCVYVVFDGCGWVYVVELVEVDYVDIEVL